MAARSLAPALSRRPRSPAVTLLLIAVAGAAGALTRYGIGQAVGVRSFPWATLGINLAGAFALGAVMAVSIARSWSTADTVPITVGYLGAFTTFSTFGYEAFTLLRAERVGAAAAYLGASVVGGLLCVAAGWAVGRALA